MSAVEAEYHRAAALETQMWSKKKKKLTLVRENDSTVTSVTY